MSESDEDAKLTKSTVKLIKAIKKRPCIYDVKHEYYRNILARKEAWKEIGEELRLDNVDSLQMKWRNLKDRYIRLKPGIQKIKYRWAPHLSFLDNITRTPRKKIRRVHKHKHCDVSIKTEIEEIDTHEIPIDTPMELYPNNQMVVDSVGQIEHNRDDIFYLFLSYAETFRKFTPKRQAKLKLEFAKLFAGAELEQIEESEM